MITKQSIESAKKLVLERQGFMCIQCKASIDVCDTKSYAFSSSKGLEDRHKFSDVDSLSCLCLKCSRVKCASSTNEARKQITQNAISFGYSNCSKCNELKHIDMFPFSINGNIRSVCKSCRNKRIRKSITKEKKDEINKKRREVYNERIKNDSKFYEQRKASWAKANKKYSLTGKRSEIDKKRTQAKYIGKSCELFLSNCYVCNRPVTSKNSADKKCANCKCNKIRKRIVFRRQTTLTSFTCKTCNCDYISTKKTNGNCVKCNNKINRSKTKRVKGHIERAKKNNAVYEKINPDVIYKRDGFKCSTCGCNVVKSKEYKPNQATIDHIIPISKGGSHTIDNIVTMCQLCNSNKSAKLINGTQIGIFCRVNDY
jgi:hypothetical protein